MGTPVDTTDAEDETAMILHIDGRQEPFVWKGPWRVNPRPFNEADRQAVLQELARRGVGEA